MRSVRAAVLLPSMFATLVIGTVIVAVVLEGPITLTEGPRGTPVGHTGRLVLEWAGMPWWPGFFFIWFLLGVFLEVLIQLAVTAGKMIGAPHLFDGLRNPVQINETLGMQLFMDCALVVSPFINGFILYGVGRSIDWVIERWRRAVTPPMSMPVSPLPDPYADRRKRLLVWGLIIFLGPLLGLSLLVYGVRLVGLLKP